MSPRSRNLSICLHTHPYRKPNFYIYSCPYNVNCHRFFQGILAKISFTHLNIGTSLLVPTLCRKNSPRGLCCVFLFFMNNQNVLYTIWWIQVNITIITTTFSAHLRFMCWTFSLGVPNKNILSYCQLLWSDSRRRAFLWVLLVHVHVTNDKCVPALQMYATCAKILHRDSLANK
jgi:hypothetical protein